MTQEQSDQLVETIHTYFTEHPFPENSDRDQRLEDFTIKWVKLRAEMGLSDDTTDLSCLSWILAKRAAGV